MAKKHIAVSIISIIIFALLGGGFLFYQIKQAGEVKAGASDNVSGWAWSENIGWISFNNTTGGGGVDYGVNIEPDGNLSGCAWSENIGWIDFEPSGPYPSSPNYSAKVDLDTKELSGWARALAYGDGWDGWIKFKKDPSEGGADYGVYIDSGEFHGFAWGSDVVGWISFNCGNQGVCGTSNYKVVTSFTFNQAPTVSNIQDPDSAESYCNVAPGLGSVGFQWKYNDADGDAETKFDFRVNNVNNVLDSHPEVDRTISNPTCIDTDPSSAISCSNTQAATVGSDLNYNTTYYWWVRVYDNQGNDSGWRQGPNFGTASHGWPWPDFTCNDADCSTVTPTADEIVVLKSTTTYYDGQGSCIWTLPPGATVDSGNPNGDCEIQVKFSKGQSQDVTLTAYDSAGYNCSHTETLNVSEPTPEWREITPY